MIVLEYVTNIGPINLRHDKAIYDLNKVEIPSVYNT